MKLIKRITAAVTVLGMLPTLVFAIKPSEMVSVNSRVVVQQDSVAVFSRPIMESYGIKSADLLSALSADGYTLKYVNSNLQNWSRTNIQKRQYLKFFLSYSYRMYGRFRNIEFFCRRADSGFLLKYKCSESACSFSYVIFHSYIPQKISFFYKV